MFGILCMSFFFFLYFFRAHEQAWPHSSILGRFCVVLLDKQMKEKKNKCFYKACNIFRDLIANGKT